jgi:hypothetical protein
MSSLDRCCDVWSRFSPGRERSSSVIEKCAGCRCRAAHLRGAAKRRLAAPLHRVTQPPPGRVFHNAPLLDNKADEALKVSQRATAPPFRLQAADGRARPRPRSRGREALEGAGRSLQNPSRLANCPGLCPAGERDAAFGWLDTAFAQARWRSDPRQGRPAARQTARRPALYGALEKNEPAGVKKPSGGIPIFRRKALLWSGEKFDFNR